MARRDGMKRSADDDDEPLEFTLRCAEGTREKEGDNRVIGDALPNRFGVLVGVRKGDDVDNPDEDDE